MKSLWPVRGITLLILSLLSPAAAFSAVTLPPDGVGVEVTVPLEIIEGPILSTPPPLPVPVLPGSHVRLAVHTLSALQIADISWAKNGVELSSHARELTLSGVATSDTGVYRVTVTATNGDVAFASRVIHVSAFPRQRLLNLSTRATISTIARSVTAGFVVDTGPGDSSSSKRLLIRAVGPTLEAYGVQGALSDPRLRLLRLDGSEIEVAPSGRDPAELSAAAERVGAAPLRQGAADAGVLISLRGGVYSAHVTSFANQVGEVLVEIYEVSAEGL